MTATSTHSLPDTVYRIEQGIISIGRVFRVFGPGRELVAYVKHPILKLREEFNIFADEAETLPLLKAKQRKLVQLNMCYDLFDGATGDLLLTVQRRLIRSIFRDRLELLGAGDTVIGSLDEVGFALLRRWIKWLPHHWTMTIGGAVVAKIDQRFTLFRKKVDIDFTANCGRLDPRAAIAAVLILMHEVHGAA